MNLDYLHTILMENRDMVYRDFMERLIPDAGLVVFAGAGHYSFLDRPFDFAAVMDNFLAEDKRSAKCKSTKCSD